MGDEPETYSRAAVPQRFGLNNTGVICHLNSLLQALVGCSAVVKTVLANREYLEKTPTGKAFYNFIYMAVPAARRSDSVPFGEAIPLEGCSAMVLHALVADLKVRRPSFNYGPNQESASEGLVLLLDMIDDPNPDPIGVEESTDSDGKLTEKIIYAENPVARLFYHRYEGRVYCNSCKKNVSEELDVAVQFNLFHYDALKKKPRLPVEFGDMLRSQVSELENYTCEKCNKSTGALRHYLLRMVPEVLVCVFNLYESNRSARYYPTRVPFPGLGGTQMIYRQVAQVEHFGSLAGGHYIARGLRADDTVYEFNDTSATPSDFRQTPNVYMTFYHCEQINEPPAASAASAASAAAAAAPPADLA